MDSPHDLAAAYVSGKRWLVSQLGNSGPHEVAEAFIAGFTACSSDAERTAPLVAAARTRERERIKGILALPEAQGRTELAAHLAYTGDATLAQARALLASAPQERPGLISRTHDKLLRAALRGAGVSNDESVLDLAMRGEGGPSVSSQPFQDRPSQRVLPSADQIYAQRAAEVERVRAAQRRPPPAD